jgi:hypothetical protein
MKLSARHVRSGLFRRGPKKAGVVIDGPVVDLFFNKIALTLITDALANLQNELLAFVQQLAGIYGSKAIAKARVLEHCADPRTRKILATLLKGGPGAPLSNKANKRFKAEMLLTAYTIYKDTEAPKKFTAAGFAKWYLPSDLCPEGQRRKLPLKPVDVHTNQNRLSKARLLVNHAG